MKRLAFAALALLLLLCGCQNFSAPRVSDTTSGSSATASLQSEETIGTTTASASKTDLDGYEFILAVQDISSFLPAEGSSAAGERLLGIYDELERSLNTKITIVSYPGQEAHLAAANSGERIADVAEITSFDIAPLASAHAIYSSEDRELVSAGFNSHDQTRWYTRVSPQVQYQGRQWTVQIASEYAFPDFGTLILANKALLDAVDPGNLWNLIETGRWTQSAYLDIAAASLKLDKEGLVYATGLTDPLAALVSSGGRLLISGDSGLTAVVSSDLLVHNGISYLSALSKTATGYARRESAGEAYQSFIEGKLTFLWLSSSELFKDPELLSVPGGFTVLPVPAPSNSGPIYGLVGRYKGFTFLRGGGVYQSVTVLNALAARISDQNWLSRYAEILGLDSRSAEIIARFVEPGAAFSLIRTDELLEDEFFFSVVNNISYENLSVSSIAVRLQDALSRLIESGVGS